MTNTNNTLEDARETKDTKDINNNFELIEVTGQDAFKFLQGQITADLELLELLDQDQDQGQDSNQNNTTKHILSSYCNIQGRVISVFYIFKLDDKYILLFLGDTAEIFLKKIKKYAQFSKIKFSDITNIYSNKDLLQGCIKNILNKEDNIDNFIDYLINHKIPIINKEFSENFLPGNLNLLDLNAVSLKKGCYLGQEIIARVYYKGKNKKELTIITNNNKSKISEDENNTIIFFNQKLDEGLAVKSI